MIIQKGLSKESPRGSQGIHQYSLGGILWGEHSQIPWGDRYGGLPKGGGVGECWCVFYVIFVVVGGVHTLWKALCDLEDEESKMALLEQPICYPNDDRASHNDQFADPLFRTS
jgi:hypothetical protein